MREILRAKPALKMTVLRFLAIWLRNRDCKHNSNKEGEFFDVRAAVVGDTPVSCNPDSKLGARVDGVAGERAIRTVAPGAFARSGSESDGRLRRLVQESGRQLQSSFWVFQPE